MSTYKAQSEEALTKARKEVADLAAFLSEPAILDHDGVVRMGALIQAQESLSRLQTTLLDLQRATHGRDVTVQNFSPRVKP